MLKLYSKLIKINFIFLILLIDLVYLFIYIISIYYSLNDLKLILTLLGLPLIFYFPGRILIDAFPSLGLKMGRFSKFGLSIFYSFSITTILGWFLQNKFGFNNNIQVYGINIFILILYLIDLIKNKVGFFQNISLSEKENNKNEKLSYDDLILPLIIGFILLLTVIINPIAQNADNYLILLKRSINEDFNLLNSRQLFISYPNLVSRFLFIDINFIFRNVYLFLFFISTFFYLDYIKRILTVRSIKNISYLSLLIPSVILTELNIIRPQLGMIIFIFPIIILNIESLKTKQYLYSIISIIFSLVSVKFHELGIFLLLMSVISLSYNIYFSIFINKTIKPITVFLFVLFIFPYIKIFELYTYFNGVRDIIFFTINRFPTINFRLWFLNSYLTIDGLDLGWKGIDVLYYYLYNGLPLLILVTIFFIIKFKSFKKVEFVIPFLFFIIFFSIAEILPRIGYFFLPNRAWVHLMLAVIILLPMLLKPFEKIFDKKFIFQYFFIILIVLGFVGTIYVANNNLGQIFKEELKSAEWIKKNTPDNAIIISSQDNETVVSVYGDRSYHQFNSNGFISKSNFEEKIQISLDELSKEKREIIQPKIIQKDSMYIDGVLISELQKDIQQQKDKIIRSAVYEGNNPVYFYYSYRKCEGMNSNRVYRKHLVDCDNYDNYKNFNYKIVYQDSYSIIMRIK